MKLQTKLLSLAAPIVITVAWDTLILGARLLGVIRAIRENAESFVAAEAIPHLIVALEDYEVWWQGEQERRAA